MFKAITNRTSRAHVTALVYRQAILYQRHIDRKFEMFFWPTVDAIMFGAIGRYAANQSGKSTLAFMLAGFVMAQIVWQSHIHLSKFFVQETWDWNVLYLMTRPISSSELFTAAISLTVCVTTVAASFITLVIALAFSLNLLVIPIGVVILIPMLMVLGWSTALFAISLILRWGQKADNFIWALFGLIGPLSGFIVSVQNLPAVLRDIAYLLPTTHAYEAGRQMLFGDEFPTVELALAAIGTIVLWGLAMFTLSRAVARFRTLGYISRYV